MSLPSLRSYMRLIKDNERKPEIHCALIRYNVCHQKEVAGMKKLDMKKRRTGGGIQGTTHYKQEAEYNCFAAPQAFKAKENQKFHSGRKQNWEESDCLSFAP